MHKSLAALLLLVGCGGADSPANNAAAPAAGATPTAPQGGEAGAAAPAPASLVGLYEGGQPGRPNQLCIVEKGGKTQFGVVAWGAVNSCSGAGEVERSGTALTLRMTGDSACTVQAEITGGGIVFRSASGAGCATYYCGHGARFEGAAFSRKGSTAADARKATDIAGDPLCG